MTEVLSVTDTLSVAFQKKDQDLVNPCAMIASCKLEIQSLRDNGIATILQKSMAFVDLYGT